MLLSRCISRSTCRAHSTPLLFSRASSQSSRPLVTLAIETSCDDSSVAVLSKDPNVARARLLFHEKTTANNSIWKGIHPLNSAEAHQVNLPPLIQSALRALPRAHPDEHDSSTTFTLPPLPGRPNENNTPTRHIKPTFISATRGPGMRACLSTGLDTAKGLALTLGIPLLGIHHMQAHLLTPRLCSALAAPDTSTPTPTPAPTPTFPLLTLLISGGHTLLLYSTSLTTHTQLATTTDIAAGDAIDKIARLVLPPRLLDAHTQDTNYGRLLEDFAFPPPPSPPSSPAKTSYPSFSTPTPHPDPDKRTEKNKWGWSLPTPLTHTRSGHKNHAMEFSFTGIYSAVRRVVETGSSLQGERKGLRAEAMGEEERRDLAVAGMGSVFGMVAGRVVRGWEIVRGEVWKENGDGDGDVVLSGGVAANAFLRHVIASAFSTRNIHPTFHVPPPALCTDNAAMIAWAGMEMWEAGWESEVGVTAEKRWKMGADGDGGGGVKGVKGWKRRDGF